MIIILLFLIFHRFRDSQGVLGVLEGPRRALRVLGSSLGRFDLLGRPGGVAGGVQRSLLGGEYIINTKVLELGPFSVTCGGVWIFFVFPSFFSSVVFVEWGVEIVVK